MPEDLSAYRKDFLIEADEILSRLSGAFVEMEKEGIASGATLDRVYRDLHTLKGMASMMGFTALQEEAHQSEDTLDEIRSGHRALDEEQIDDLLETLDRLGAMVENIRGGGDGDLSVVEAEDPDVVGGPPDSRFKDTRRVVRASPGRMSRPPSTQVTFPHTPSTAIPISRSSSTWRVPVSRVDTRRAAPPEATVRVGVDRLDGLLDLVGEVVIARNRLQQLVKDREDISESEELVDAMGAFNRLVGDLQAAVLAIRMLPVGSVLERFPRYVRDMARELGKQVDVIVEGGATELDRAVLELLKDPLAHIVRNAVDHGLESAKERLASGKPAVGRLHIAARPEEGSIVLEIADDGRGISHEKVLAAAKSRGLITAETASRMTEVEVLEMIFYPGLSTASSVSDLSGRGVGMDVVRASLEDLGGHIEVASQPGTGTCFIIKLPLTLAIMKALKVSVGSEQYGVPLPVVLETLRIERESIREVAGRRMLLMREELLPILELASVFELEPEEGRFQYAVIVSFGGRRAALIVDGLVGQEEVVLKPLGEYLRGGCGGISGATILGDGRVMLILDIGALLDLTARGEYGMVSRP